MQVNSHLLPEKNQGIQQKSTPAKRDKMCGQEENNILSSIYIPLSCNFMINKALFLL